MSTENYEAACASTRSVLASLQADHMAVQTPCESWDVAGVINHVVGGTHFFAAGMRGEQPQEGQDWASGDYLAAFDSAVAESVAAFQAEGALEKTISLPFGDMPGSAVMGLATTDTFTHGWDLAKATGQDTNLAPELASALHQQSRQMIQPAFRGEDGQAPFGMQQECDDDSCAADQLAAFLGRTV